MKKTKMEDMTMKRYFFSLVAISAIFASCTKEELKPTTPDSNDGTYSFKALISDASKTSINDDGAMAWITGDKISVYDGAFETFTLKGEASGAEATFTGELTDPSAVDLAVCPDGIGGEVADEMLTLKLPVSYEYDGQSTHAPMIATEFAVNDKETTIKFKHVGGLFKVTYNNVPEEAKTFCFEASKQIAGELYIEDYTATGAAIAVDETGTNKSVTYSINPTEDDHSSMSFYVPVPVGTFDFNISLKDEAGNKIAKSSKTKNGFTIERGDYVAIPAINMPRKFVEEFNSTSKNANHSKYGSGLGFTSSEVTKQFDYAWTYDGKVCLFVGGVRLGTSESGTISSEEILDDIVDGENFTVKVYGAAWKTDNGNISVTYNEKTFDSAPANAAITNTGTTDDDVYDPDDFTESTDFVFAKSADAKSLSVTTTSGRVFIDKIEIVEGGVLPEPFSVSTESLTPAWDDTEATFDITAGDKVDWSIAEVEGLTFSKNDTDFSAELVGTGNATVKVAFSENTAEQQVQKEITVSTDYANVEGENSYTINFTQEGKPQREMDGDGSVEKPFSVADALYKYGLLGENEETQEYYVKGIVRTVGVSLSSGALSYYIGSSDENQIQVFKGKDLGNINFSAATDLTEGDEVVVYGKIYNYVNYSKESTAEINQGNYLYSINGKTSILTGIAVSGQKTSFAQNETWEFGGTVTASYRGKNAADVTSVATFKVNGSDPSTATIGKGFTVTVSYEEGVVKTTTYTYDVYDPDAVTLIQVKSVNDFTAGMYVIMSYDKAYYVPNAAATNAGPTVTAVTKTGDEINITPAMVWNATAANGGLEFSSLSVSNSKLWGAGKNDGVRVTNTNSTSGASTVWNPESNDSYGIVAYAGVDGSSNKYYLATNVTSDWRNYKTSTLSSTYKPANFFKLLNWTMPKHKLTITDPSNGTIIAKVGEVPVSSGSEIEEGKTITITATPADNYLFSNWTVGGATVEDASAATTTFVVGQEDITVSADFISADVEYDVTVASEITGGEVTVDKSKAKANDIVTITATPSGTNVLRTLKVTGNTSGEEVTVTDKKFTMPAEAVTVSATFGAEEKTITINASKIANFTGEYLDRTWTDESISGKCYAFRAGSSEPYLMQFNNTPYVYNTTKIPGRITSIKMVKGGGNDRDWTPYVDNKAINNDNYTSAPSLGKQTIGTNGYTWTTDANTNYSYFYLRKGSNSTQISEIVITYEPSGDTPEPTTYTLTLTQVTGGTISAEVDGQPVSNGAKIEEDKTVTITAVASSGYSFNSWALPTSGLSSSTLAMTTFTMNANTEVKANFTSTGGGTGGTATSSNLGASTTNAQTLESGKPITYKVNASNDFSNPLRVYSGKTLTIAGATITKIEIEGEDSKYPVNKLELNNGGGSLTTTSSTKIVWEGSSTSVVFQASAQARVSTITVTYTN